MVMILKMKNKLNMRTVLVTGFEPFDGAEINPSQEIARNLNGTVISGHTVVGALLPCVFGVAIPELRRLLRVHRPALVICVGQAGGRKGITPERVAINIDDARIPDNAGAQPLDCPVVRGGPTAYFSTLPVKAIAAALREAGLPGEVSQTAGSFVCNHVFYGLMHALRMRKGIRGGFIHVPFLPEQAQKGQASLPLEDMVFGVALAVETALRLKKDLRLSGGQTE
ncbi:MAG: pyroglutamyl-peptidase I [Opitutaceae bacterium]